MSSISSSSELINNANEEIEIASLKNSFASSAKAAKKKSNYGSMRSDSAPQAVAQPTVNYTHQIRPGDTLQGVSLKYNISVSFVLCDSHKANQGFSHDPMKQNTQDELFSFQTYVDSGLAISYAVRSIGRSTLH